MGTDAHGKESFGAEDPARVGCPCGSSLRGLGRGASSDQAKQTLHAKFRYVTGKKAVANGPAIISRRSFQSPISYVSVEALPRRAAQVLGV
jgi:hypothetical protein